MNIRTFGWQLVLLVLSLMIPSVVQAANGPQEQEWVVDGVVRHGLVVVPQTTQTNAIPVVFVFHGHGGTMNQAARKFAIHAHWPTALVVYLQGLNGPGHLLDQEGKESGWQITPGDQGDRDLKLFDAVLASLRHNYQIDDKRIYATGHSNGGYFTYLLWAARGDQLAAVAPVAAAAGSVAAEFKPKPVLHIAGQNDPLVKFAWQAATMNRLRKLNGCGEGQPWGGEPGCTLYASRLGAPVVTWIHPGKHEFPATAGALIVKFFKAQARL